MVYLNKFIFPSDYDEESFYINANNPYFKTKNYRTAYTTKYPFGIFYQRGLPEEFVFSEITIFCGNNGSGKSTLLNIIAERLGLEHRTVFNRSDFFSDYVELCGYMMGKIVKKGKTVSNFNKSQDKNRNVVYRFDEPDNENDGESDETNTYDGQSLPKNSAIITSDDVFENVLGIRRLNDGIDDRREELIKEYIQNRNPDQHDIQLHSLADYDRWQKVVFASKKSVTQSQYLRKNLMRNVTERSNGESALSFFVDSIKDNALYLLDEPENSLSPQNQISLKYFIEDSARNHGCQFIISTHSPFLLSLRRAKIYDIDENPVDVKYWTDLDCVRVYHDFFAEHDDEF